MATPFYLSGLSSTAKPVIQQGPANVGALTIYNASNAVAYVQCFNVSETSAVTVGTTKASWVVPIPTVASLSLSFPDPVRFDKGLVIVATTTAAGSSAPSSALDVALTLA